MLWWEPNALGGNADIIYISGNNSLTSLKTEISMFVTKMGLKRRNGISMLSADQDSILLVVNDRI
jgi:hypothetical protein